jgi:hypothetical protein
MSYDSWLEHNPADDGGEQDVELFYECENEWAVDTDDPTGDWMNCDFADTVELPDTWVSDYGVASGELKCPKCGVVKSFEFEIPDGDDE